MAVYLKISDCPAASSANATDQLEVNQAGTSRRVTVAQVATAVGTSTPIVFISPDNLPATNIAQFLPNNLSLGVAVWYNGVRATGANNSLFLGGDGTGVVRFTTPVMPDTDNTLSCGHSSARWSVVYAGTGAINTSGADEKLDIVDPSEAERKAAARIKAIGPKRYKLKDAVAAKGDAARLHFGFIAEDVRDALAAEGLDPWAYGMLCADPVMVSEPGEGEMAMPRQVPLLDDAGNPVVRLGLRYDELHSFLMGAYQ